MDRAQQAHAAGAIPSIPFIAELPDAPDASQGHLFGAPPPPVLAWADWQAQLLAHAGPLQRYLGLRQQELRDEAQRLPMVLHELSHQEAFPGYAARMVAAAERLFGEPVPGQTLDAQLARVRDAKGARVRS